MHLEVLVEEESAEAALQNLIPKIVGAGVSFRIHPFQGKPDLMDQLPKRLRGYCHWLPNDWRIVVLLDKDRQDCNVLKAKLEQLVLDAGLTTRHSASGGQVHVLNRLAGEELEAWFFGDVDAIVTAYPRVPPTLGSRATCRDPDTIKGGTWEALYRVLKRVGYYPEAFPKVEVARSISAHMNPDRNRSRSFQVFRDGLRRMIGG